MGKKKDTEVKSDTAETPLAPSEAAQLRLDWILQMTAEGLSDEVQAGLLSIDSTSVRNIRNNHWSEVNGREHVFNSSISLSLMNHTPDEDQLEQIKKLRAAADEFAQLVDRYGRHNERAQAIALKELEDTLMWAVKAVIVPPAPRAPGPPVPLR